MKSWSKFLFKLGYFLGKLPQDTGERPAVVLSLPCLNFGSTLVASGIIAGKFENRGPVDCDMSKWGDAIGESVCFPYLRHREGERRLRRRLGIVQGFDTHKGRQRLLVTVKEDKKAAQELAVDPRWFPLLGDIDSVPDLTSDKLGSILAHDVHGLEALLGQKGICGLLATSSLGCCIVDVGARVREESRESLALKAIGVEAEGEIILRDLLRFRSESSEAIADTNCCHLTTEIDGGWDSTILAGALRYQRGWDDCDSRIRVAILATTEPNYPEAAISANQEYARRAQDEFVLPDNLLELKPATIQVQSFYSR